MISNYDISLVSVIHMLKEVCSMTTSFPANYFFSVFISKDLLQPSIMTRVLCYIRENLKGTRKTMVALLF